MRIARLSISVLIAGSTLAAGEDIAATPSAIDAVTVYLDRAWVTRKAKVRLVAGATALRFAGLPAEFDDASLRVALSGGVRLDGLLARSVLLTQRSAENVRVLEKAMAAADANVQEQRDLVGVLDKAFAFLNGVEVSRGDKLSKELGRVDGKGPEVADYKAVLGFLVDERLALAGRLRQARAALAELEPVAAAKRHEVEQAKRTSSLEQKEVLATLTASEAGEVEISVSYMLPGALWFPTYDLRVDSERKHARLEYHAMVQQATGEDWSNVALTLSAARPTVAVRAPKLEPWFVTPRNLAMLNGPNGTSAGALRQLAQAESQSGTFGDDIRIDQEQGKSYNPRDNLLFQSRNRAASNEAAHKNLIFNAVRIERVSQALEHRTTSSVFPVAARESIASTGKPQRVAIVEGDFDLARSYVAVPRTSLATYVVAQAVNNLKLPILPGEARLHVGADLVGTSTLDFVAPNEATEFYLGKDESIALTREIDNKNSGRTFFGSKKRLEIAYTVTVRNHHDAAVDVAVHEALPVSQDERIRIKVQTLAPKPVESDRGVTRWNLTLAKGESKTVTFAYTIEYPDDLVIGEFQQWEQTLKAK